MWEPRPGVERLMLVGKTSMRFVVASMLLAVVTLPIGAAIAQNSTGPFSMEVTAGMEGFVDPNAVLPVTVDLTSQELVVGRIEVTSGGTTVRTDVEIPAGGVKQYFIEAGAPGNRTQVEVLLVRVDDNGETDTLLEQTIRVSPPRDELLVGLLGFDELATTLRSAEPLTVSRNVTPVRVTSRSLETGPGILSYLVVADDRVDDLSSDAQAAIEKWIGEGGVLMGDAAAAGRFSAQGAGRVWPGTGVEMTRVGRGEVGAAVDLMALTVDQWSSLLQPEPAPGLIRNEIELSAPVALLSAASVGREATVPALPWLLVGILVFVVLVGPANFVVLRSFGKPELAWVTVPLLSVAFVAGFWLIGRSQLKDFSITHAAVVVDDGESAEGSTAFVLQVATGGDRELVLPDGWKATPSSGQVGGLPGVPESRDDGRDGFQFDLEDLGAGVGQAQWHLDEPVAIEAAIIRNGDSQAIQVSNAGTDEYWAWGIVLNGIGFAGQGELAAGQQQESVTVRSGVRRVIYEPVISEVVNRTGYANGFSDTRYQLVSSLAGYAEYIEKGIRLDDVYFYGFTDDPEYSLSLDGSAGVTEGSTLVVKRLDLDIAGELGGSVRPQLLDVIGASSIEGYYDDIYAYGAEEVYLVYEIPDGSSGRGRVAPGVGQFPQASAFDWEAGEYADIEWSEPFDVTRFVSPGGQMVIRARIADDRDPFQNDGSIQLSRYQLTWSLA